MPVSPDDRARGGWSTAGNGHSPGNLPPLPAHLDPRGRHRHGSASASSTWHYVRWGTQVLATALSMLLLVTFGVYWWKYHTFSNGLQKLNIFGASAGLNVNKPKTDIDGKAQNLLIVGNDDRQSATDAELKQLGTGRDGGSLNTDTMMIVHIPADGTKATLVSLPRDSYVAIPGYGMDKLNAAYPDAYGNAAGSVDAKRAAGAKLLVQTIQNLTGLTIDHFVQVDLLGFYRISNAIGGVTVNMCAAVQEPESGIKLHKGVNTIRGKQALAFVRQRYNFPNGLGDLDRVQRQRYFLTAAFRKLTSAGVLLNPSKLQNLLNAVKSSLYMDSGLDPLGLARQMTNLSADNIVGQTIPTDGFATSSSGASVVSVTPTKVQTFIQQLIGPVDTSLAKAPLISPSQVVVNVLNGSGINGTATTNAATLRSAGFQTGTVDSAPAAQNVTVIQYADGMQSAAKTVAAYVPGAVLEKVPSVSHVTLILGADGKVAKIPVTTPTGTTSHPAPSPTPTTKPPAIDATCIN